MATAPNDIGVSVQYEHIHTILYKPFYIGLSIGQNTSYRFTLTLSGPTRSLPWPKWLYTTACSPSLTVLNFIVSQRCYDPWINIYSKHSYSLRLQVWAVYIQARICCPVPKAKWKNMKAYKNWERPGEQISHPGSVSVHIFSEHIEA